MKNSFIIFTFCLLLQSCAGLNSYRFSKNTASFGSNIYVESGFGASKFSNDPLSLNEDTYSSIEEKVSIDAGIKLGNFILSGEYGYIYNDFEKQVYDPTVEGDYRVDEEFAANSTFKRANITRRYPSSSGQDPSFYSFQIYYDFEIESTFRNLPKSVDQTITGKGRGYQLNLNFPSIYVGFGQNWRDYDLSNGETFKMQEFYLHIGFVLLVI